MLDREKMNDVPYLSRKKDEALAEKGKILDRAINESRELTSTEKTLCNSYQNEADRCDLAHRDIMNELKNQGSMSIGGGR